jgi:hypothetical protein
MKKFIIGFITSLLLINVSYGQEVTRNDSVTTYKKINKWAVVKLTIAYMEDLRDWSSSFEEKKINDASQKEEWAAYKKLDNEYAEFTNNIDLDSVAEILSKGWGETRDEVFKAYKLELIDSIKRFHFKEVVFNPKKTLTTSKRKSALNFINRQYDKLIYEKSAEISNARGKEVRANRIKDIVPQSKKGIDWGQMFLYALLVISVLFNLFLFFKSRSKSENNKKEKKINYDAYKSKNASLEKIKIKLEEENTKLKNEKWKNSNPVSPVEKVIRPIEKIIEDEEPLTIEFKVPEIKNKLIYFPSPFEERRFAIEDVSETEKPTSLYVANVNANSNKGDISLIETADLSRALNSPNIYLETVCEYENAYNSEAKGIKVVEDGEVILDGEDWVVKSKIKIKFI